MVFGLGNGSKGSAAPVADAAASSMGGSAQTAGQHHTALPIGTEQTPTGRVSESHSSHHYPRASLEATLAHEGLEVNTDPRGEGNMADATAAMKALQGGKRPNALVRSWRWLREIDLDPETAFRKKRPPACARSIYFNEPLPRRPSTRRAGPCPSGSSPRTRCSRQSTPSTTSSSRTCSSSSEEWPTCSSCVSLRLDVMSS